MNNTLCNDHGTVLDANGVCKNCEQKAIGEAQWQKVMQAIEKLPDNAQQRIIECGMHMREMACFYGPYFSMALVLTSAEIAAERLLMPKMAECDNAPKIMMPGGVDAEELKKRKIIVLGNKTEH